jgi:rhodanese-related sulfurtransferase
VIQGLLAATLLTALVGRGRTWGGHAAVVCGLMWTCTVLAGAGLTHMRSVDSWTASPSVTREFIGSVRRIPVEVSELAVDEFIREDAMMRETTTIIDARAPDAFAAIHLPTAINVPLTDSFSERERALSGVDRLQRVVVYCEPFGCPLAQRLAAELIRQHGFKRVVTLSGDWRPWAGMELDR